MAFSTPPPRRVVLGLPSPSLRVCTGVRTYAGVTIKISRIDRLPNLLSNGVRYYPLPSGIFWCGHFDRLRVAQFTVTINEGDLWIPHKVNANFEIDSRGGHCQRFVMSLVVSYVAQSRLWVKVLTDGSYGFSALSLARRLEIPTICRFHSNGSTFCLVV